MRCVPTGPGGTGSACRPWCRSTRPGAGDCFNAGLIAGLLQGLALAEAAALGCAAGALSTRAPGGTGSSPGLAAALALAGDATVTTPSPRTSVPILPYTL